MALEIENIKLVKKITFISNDFQEEIVFEDFNNAIEIPYSNNFKSNSFDLKIAFNSNIKKIRMPDYSWSNLNQNRIIPQFCNQIIQLENGFYLQPENIFGIWETNKKEANVLIWKFNPENSSNITNYEEDKNIKKINTASFKFPLNKTLKLLLSKTGALEISRSKIPFSATVCFTDHCDFDTLDLTQKQRVFFKDNDIKITKGFFLNHFSKRKDNISWQNESQELQKWINDGHELTYHSLSQSLKSDQESFEDFFNFEPPTNISTWIDHGYQPYNLSLFKKNNISEKLFSDNLKQKNISILWNYIDSGTATSGVINQLNTNDFSLNSFWKGIKNKPFKTKLSLIIKNTIYHFYNDEQLIQKYTNLASSFKKAIKTKSILDLFQVFKNSFQVFAPLIRVLIFWNSNKNKIYKTAKYCPIFFEHNIENEKFVVFQTLELLDFIEALNKKSIDKLMLENGLFIGHTYFSVPMNYHDGKIFDSNGIVNNHVSENFKYLGEQIKNKKIWNPTLVELVQYWIGFNKVIFEINDANAITVQNNYEYNFRKIS